MQNIIFEVKNVLKNTNLIEILISGYIKLMNKNILLNNIKVLIYIYIIRTILVKTIFDYFLLMRFRITQNTLELLFSFFFFLLSYSYSFWTDQQELFSYFSPIAGLSAINQDRSQ